MKLAIANVVRSRYINEIMEYLTAKGEDVALTASNTCNMPFVEDGEEGVLEVVVKVVKKDYDECMQEREDYIAKCAEKAERDASAMPQRKRPRPRPRPQRRPQRPQRRESSIPPLFYLFTLILYFGEVPCPAAC